MATTTGPTFTGSNQTIGDTTTMVPDTPSDVASTFSPIITQTASGDSSNVGAIVGGIIGGLCAVGLIIAFIIFWRRRKSRDIERNEVPQKNEHRISTPTVVGPRLEDADSDYDSVLPAAAQASYNDYGRSSQLHPADSPVKEDEGEQIYINEPASPYVNFSAAMPNPINVRVSHYDDEQEHYYGNVPHPSSRTPSTRRPNEEEEEDEYVPMDNYHHHHQHHR